MTRSSRRVVSLVAVCAILCTVGTALSRDMPVIDTGDEIAFLTDVAKAFEKAKSEKRIVMICINNRLAKDGREEPAAKALREVVYLDPRVVERARAFVCVLLTSAGSSADYGELRARFGIDGLIVSPQHIFALPDHKSGDTPLARREYWPYGKGDSAVKALLTLMDKAATAGRARANIGPAPETKEGADPKEPDTPPSETPAAPPTDGERAVWIQKLLGLVRMANEDIRREALKSLVQNDKDGDCIDPLIALLPRLQKDAPVLVDVVRALGVPELEKAAEPVCGLLAHKEESVRGNAAVSLEYIGSQTSVAELTKRVKKEKSEAVANHMSRALGRCGAGDAKVRNLLLKRAQGGKSSFATYGPIIGLAYFEGDAKTARALEKLLLKLGQPFSGGRNRNVFGRAIVIWALSEVRDPKSAPWFRKRYVEPLDKIDDGNRFKANVVQYYVAVARKLEGDDDAQADIIRGIRRYLDWNRTARGLKDEARRDRDTSRFEPKMEYERLRDDG